MGQEVEMYVSGFIKAEETNVAFLVIFSYIDIKKRQGLCSSFLK